jgi:hypothetical protein
VGASQVMQKCYNENNDNIRGEITLETVGNCKSQYNILSYHGPESVLTDHYFGNVQLRRLQNSNIFQVSQIP